MKAFSGWAGALVLCVSLSSTASAAPAAGGTDAKRWTGLQNAKKAASGARERDRKLREVKKQAYAKREQALAKGR